ncbi:MAG TPA: ELM1/GtrOC1 family putative glycosyltransferase [Geminicoccaceae bacterium]|nr:ELM1/GtrOC1 family putative glycosyltransferase [Geminicoccaceae bacterium]
MIDLLRDSKPLPSDNPDQWPFFRELPDRVVLGLRAGTAPSTAPPVRIFLGTEEAQYRAERVFFYSIERVRDPSRTYEIHLMKNLAGFDRKGWRTGFTNYRFAIPDFAGRTGKAIYNDVDQIYLADPAELFDLDMDGHGYLAISAKDTSVMLIDCARMAPIWNREAASTGGKHALTNQPAATPGLWGRLDGHWNARDQEYREGLTKCLHYTALHQQPWQPFPGDYSYHANPLAYIWHDLERAADGEGYQVFRADAPSPAFARIVQGDGAKPAARPLPAAALELLGALGVQGALAVTVRGDAPPLPGIETAMLDLAHGAERLPGERAEAAVAVGVLDHVPPADLGWLLDGLFAAAGKALVATVGAAAPDGLGSPEWWRRRVAEAAARHPGVSWHLEVAAGGGAPAAAYGSRRVEDPGAPRVWALVAAEARDQAQVVRLAEALGWPYETKRLHFNARSRLPNMVLGAALQGLDRDRSSPLEGPWPDLVIAAGRESVPVARWIRARSGGRTRLVQLGRPGAPFDLFDLIVATPQHRLPIRDNVLHVTAPLSGLVPESREALAGQWQERLRGLAPPHAALFVGSRWPWRLSDAAAAELGALAAAEAKAAGASLLVLADPSVSEAALAALRGRLDVPHHLVRGDGSGDAARAAFLALAERVIVTGDDPATLAEACLVGKPALLFELPKWYDRLVVVRPALKGLSLLVGGGTSYRGTPHQQHVLGRLVDELTARGLVALPRDPDAFYRALAARGLVQRAGERDRIAQPKPLDDLQLTVERVRRLMSERAGAI